MNNFLKQGLVACIVLSAFSFKAQTNQKISDVADVVDYNSSKQPNFIQLKTTVYESNVENFLNNTLLSGDTKVKKYRTNVDDLGFTHTKYQLYYQNTLIDNSMIVVHSQNGKVISINGDLSGVQTSSNKVAISEQTALTAALSKINAVKYKWQNTEEEQHMKQVFNNPDFTFYPKADLVLFTQKSKEGVATASYAYKFNVYAEEPLYRANVFVDAQSGKVLSEQNLLCTSDVTATANTKYSGSQTMTTDMVAANSYRLREVARGNGIETYNMKNTTTYSATDFTNTTTSWTITTADQAATDAHWGAEKTYDYYKNVHSRNSIDGAGYKLLSYVHYSNSYNNAFWDGTRMTYGDGNGSLFTILTALDVCGHEITHGLTNFTGGLNGGGSGEPDALNEAFSDIFGTTIENYARPTQWDWIMGKDITPNNLGIRNMQNPKSMTDPNCYLGQYWDFAGEPHNNAGPADFWYYLLTTGGGATNDIGNTYTVTGITMAKAAKIAFRALTVYFVPSTDYPAARAACIQAAKDLYGNCSNEVVQTTNAWYGVGVGQKYGVVDFMSAGTSFCSVPVTINFNNSTIGGTNYTWTYGDGSTSTSTVANAAHTYTNSGTFNVKLKATGCITDSITKNAYITINTPPIPSGTGGTTACGPGTVNLSASGSAQQYWYATPTPTGVPLNIGTNYTTPVINVNTTYYVVNTSTNAPVFGAPSSTAIGTSAVFAGNYAYDIFDVFQPCTLRTVVVYASTAGVRTIELRDAASTILTSTNINCAIGVNTITVNIPFTPGTNYQLGLSSSSTCNFYRNSTGATAFPYNIGGLVSITGTSASQSGYFYFYYNWQVQKDACKSPAVAVTATVTAGTPVNVAASNTLICSGQTATLQASGATSYTFNPGGITSNPATISPGITTTYTVLGTTGSCNGFNVITINVSTCTGITEQNVSSGINVYPNPARDYFTVNKNNNDKVSVKVYDNTGKLVTEKSLEQSTEQVDISKLANGSYFIEILNSGNRIYKTVIIKQ